jgi:dUTP pyrophosphatase
MAQIEKDIFLLPGERVLVPTGVKIEEAYFDEFLMVAPRSGLAINHGVTVLNAPGIVDSDYKDEIKIVLINLSNKIFVINNGMSIAQGVVCKCDRMAGTNVSDMVRFGGFGSTD